MDDKNLFCDAELYLDFGNGILSVQNYSDAPSPDAIAEFDLPFKLAMGQSTQVSGTDLHIQLTA